MQSRLFSTTIPMLLMAFATVPVKAAGHESIRVARYSLLAPTARPEQAHLLAAVVTVHFPDTGVRTVGDAVRYLLIQTGYRFANPVTMDPTVAELLDLSLPETHRTLGPITLQAALETLAGPTFRLVHNPIYRLVSFELLPAYRSLRRGAGT